MIKIIVETKGKIIKDHNGVIVKTPCSILINDDQLNNYKTYMRIHDINEFIIVKDVEYNIKNITKIKQIKKNHIGYNNNIKVNIN